MAADCKSAAPCELRRFESSPVHQVLMMISMRLVAALSAFAVLALLAWFTLDTSIPVAGREVPLRAVTLAILGLFLASVCVIAAVKVVLP